MMKLIKKQSNYLFIILLSIGIYTLRSDYEFYVYAKYISTPLIADIMLGLLMSYFTFKVYLDDYYYMVLNRVNIITRVGKKKYNEIILKKLFLHSFFLVFINCIMDFILIKRIYILIIFTNIIISAIMVIVLPKRKEHDNELFIILVISIILKSIFLNILK